MLYSAALLVLLGCWLQAHGERVAARLQRDITPSLRVVDRHGVLLRVHRAEPGLHHEPIPFAQMSPLLLNAVVTAEDRHFYRHPGVDPLAIVRALWLDFRAGTWRYGASTITMQVVRMGNEPAPRTVVRKLGEIVDALALERVQSKNEILTTYLNRIPFGHGTVGVEAASRYYFQKPAHALQDADGLTLAVLVRGPSYYDLQRHSDRVVARRQHILDLMVQSHRLAPESAAALHAELPTPSSASLTEFRAPTAVDYALAEIPSSWRERGGTVMTAIDIELQESLERAVKQHVDDLAAVGATHAAAVIVNARSGEIWAMVGSPDYQSREGGAINMAAWRRHPGSTLKPFVYALAIEKGRSPASVVLDIFEAAPSGFGRPDLREHGPVTLREALAGSYNLAALTLIDEVGVAALHERLSRAGLRLGSDDPQTYGAGLALGAAKIRLVDLAAAYRVFIHEGMWLTPSIWRSYVDRHGKAQSAVAPEPIAVFTAQSAALTRDILADAQARRAAFGEELPADLPYPVVVKTGTAQGFADTVAVFATQEWIAAAWTGRQDGQAMHGVLGMQGAAPLARSALLLASHGRFQHLPAQPTDLKHERLCAFSGLRAHEGCPFRHEGAFVADAAMPALCTWHQQNGKVAIDALPLALRTWLHREGRAVLTMVEH